MTSTSLADNNRKVREALEADVRSRIAGFPTQIRVLLERALGASQDDLADLMVGACDAPAVPVVVSFADTAESEPAAF